jgi:Domain of unknown function (DUF1996)/WSC domain
MKLHPFSVLLLSSLFCASHGFWRMNCGVIQTGRIDPIMNPGSISSHVHKIAGGSNFYLNATYTSMQQSSCTSCEIQDDKSAYWTPQLYWEHSNGSFEAVPNSGMVVYYLGRGENRSNVVPFPPGFQMLSGDPLARGYDNSTYTFGGKSGVTYVGGTCGNGTCIGGTWSNDSSATGPRFLGRPVSDRVSFNCLAESPLPETPAFNQTNCVNGLRAQVQFQSCWDGVHLSTADNSHVAYMSQIDNGVCPPTHPIQLPHLFFEVLYAVNQLNASSSAGGRLVFANGDPTGYGFHGDFLNGWNMTTQRAAADLCLIPDNNGQISACAALSSSDSTAAGTNCPPLPSIIQEPVLGVLPQLPGCVAITNGPAPAPLSSMTCPSNSSLPHINPPSPQPAPPSTPKQNATFGNWTYLGCASELPNSAGSRLFSGPSTTATNMTNEACREFCALHNSPLAGTEYATQCFCAPLSALPSGALNASCDQPMLCAGNRSEYCGAPDRLSVWKIAAA